MERYVFRPFGQLAIAGSGALLVLFLGLGAQYAGSGQAIETGQPMGLPHSARARIYTSNRPQPCYSQVMIGCIEVDTESRSLSIPLYPEAAASFGLRAPSAPGTYWIALDADWGAGGTTQVFVIDVRA